MVDIDRTPGRSDEAARTILRQARDALGGEAALGSIRGFRGVGRTSRVLGPMRVAGEVELHVALPDRYVRIDRLTFGTMTSEMAGGFNGSALIQRARGPDGLRLDVAGALPHGAQALAPADALTGMRQEAALMLLGFLSASVDFHPLDFVYAGAAESAEGEAQAIDITGLHGLRARFFIDARSHLPLFVSWLAPNVASAVPSLGSTPPAAMLALLESLQPVEHRIYFGDFRTVGAIRWPFRIRRSIAAQPTEELRFDAFTLNPVANARVFDAAP
jgi:hypothetical protein